MATQVQNTQEPHDDFGIGMRWVKRSNIFRRNGVEVENQTGHDITDLVVTPLGVDLVGVSLLGSPLGLLNAGQRVVLFFSSEPSSRAKLRFRLTYTRTDGTIAAADLAVRQKPATDIP